MPGHRPPTSPRQTPLDRCCLPLLSHHAHLILSVFLVIVTPVITGVILWRSDHLDHPQNSDDDQEDDRGEADLPAAA